MGDQKTVLVWLSLVLVLGETQCSWKQHTEMGQDSAQYNNNNNDDDDDNNNEAKKSRRENCIAK